MSPAELELLIRKVFGEGLQLHPSVYVLIVTITLVAGGVGAFVGAYLKRRGETLATKADFDVLSDQVRQQTRETEQIKSEIARAGWIHQRRWDLKREIYWRLLETLEEIKQKGRLLDQMLQSYWSPTPEARQVIEEFAKHMQERGTAEKLISSKAAAAVVLNESAVEALDVLTLEYNEFIDLLVQNPDPVDAFFGFGGDRFRAMLEATEEAYRIVLSSSQKDLLESPHEA